MGNAFLVANVCAKRIGSEIIVRSHVSMVPTLATAFVIAKNLA